MSAEAENGGQDTLTVENRGARPEIRHMNDDEAGAAIAALFESKPERKRDAATGKFVSDKPAESTDAEQPAPEAKAGDTPPDAEQEAEDGEKSADDEQPDTEALRYDPEKHGKILVPVKVDGVETLVPIDEVKSGYSRTKDYTQKTQALAEERKKFENEVAVPARAEREQLRTNLAQLEAIVRAAMPDTEPDWDKLAAEATPEEFQAQFTNWKKNSERIGKIRAQQEAVQARIEADAQAQLERHLATEHEKLKEAIPEFRDAEKGKQLHDDLVAYAKSLGYTSDDLAQVTDHRLLVVLNQARLYTQAQKSRSTVETKVDRALDKGLKPSGVGTPKSPNRFESAKAKLAKSGSIDDAADAIGALLGTS